MEIRIQKKSLLFIALIVLFLFSSKELYGQITTEDTIGRSERSSNLYNSGTSVSQIGPNSVTSTISENRSSGSHIGYVDATLGIKEVSFRVSSVDFILSSALISFQDDRILNLKDMELNLNRFTGTLKLEGTKILLEGSFTELSNDNINFGARNNVKVVIYEGDITSTSNYISSLSVNANGVFGINDGDLILKLKEEYLSIIGFDGAFTISLGNPNTLSLLGSLESFSVNNVVYKISVNK
ncbi:MAG: hypothetical protein QF362_04475 [Candidatus Woesearchaeota archaeon]|jgi:hypothetical protein|nr:hypothetical protein [Candidatus Woesearchaeota archaeon]MDP7506669.1 hypothetical protein [Candidatus Woesearchaeota archaeon]MDP7610727.1 hypothetical protein [Candidatus Woesearchaeota archaeon]